MLMVVAPAWTAMVTIFTRKSGSVRVASSAENSTSSVKVRARRTDSAACSSAWARLIFSLASRWRSEEARKVWMRDFSAGSMERAAASMSSRLQRASDAMRELRTSRAIWRMESESPWLAMAKPASMTSTPRSASWWAIRSFSS
jgi:hypothetical protein